VCFYGIHPCSGQYNDSIAFVLTCCKTWVYITIADMRVYALCDQSVLEHPIGRKNFEQHVSRDRRDLIIIKPSLSKKISGTSSSASLPGSLSPVVEWAPPAWVLGMSSSVEARGSSSGTSGSSCTGVEAHQTPGRSSCDSGSSGTGVEYRFGCSDGR
jgi:hypothetical protein